jgi:hypothetical protein
MQPRLRANQTVTLSPVPTQSPLHTTECGRTRHPVTSCTTRQIRTRSHSPARTHNTVNTYIGIHLPAVARRDHHVLTPCQSPSHHQGRLIRAHGAKPRSATIRHAPRLRVTSIFRHPRAAVRRPPLESKYAPRLELTPRAANRSIPLFRRPPAIPPAHTPAS